MAKKFWWPKRISEQRALISVFRAHIPTAGVAVGMTPAEISAAIDLCDSLLEAISYADSFANTAKSITTWRNQILYGKQKGNAVARPQAVEPPESLAYLEGSVGMFFDLRHRIMASAKYSKIIGRELGLIGPEIAKLVESEISPELKISAQQGSIVNIGGSMKGFDALSVQYAPEGGEFQHVAFLTRTPAEIKIPAQTPGLAEKGSIRAIYLKANHSFGSFSPTYPVVTW
jgi:hypothetical protein